MENSHLPVSSHCLNCGAVVEGSFCPQCSQSVRDNSDRSLSRLTGEVFGNIFFLDNRFLLSIWYLFRYPSRMTAEFLEGKRKKFISPVTLFLFLNLIYFFVNPLSDYSLSLHDQISSQPYSKWSNEWVTQKIQDEKLNADDYAIIYQKTSDSISKSVMILNVPMIAFFVYLMAFKKRSFYFDSLIFAFHYFSVFMVSWVMLDWSDNLITFITKDENSLLSSISFNLFTLIIPLLYAILGIKRFMNFRWYWSIPAGLGIMIGVFLANFTYRFIIFSLTFWNT